MLLIFNKTYMQSRVNAPFLSRVSVVLSGVCIVHCLVTPIIILALPAISVFFDPFVETLLIVSIIPISAAGFLPTWFKHKNYRLLRYYLVGISIMILTHFGFHYFGLADFLTGHTHEVGHNHSHASLSFTESAFMITGALILAWATWKNNKHTHVCKNPNHVH